MNCDQLRPADNLTIRSETPLVRNQTRARQFWGTRWTFMELALCTIVPSLTLFTWTQCDKELRSVLLAGSEKDQHLRANAVYGIVAMEGETALAAHADGRIQFWNIAQATCFGELQSQLPDVHCADYCPHQKLLAVGSTMGSLEVWDLAAVDHPLATANVSESSGAEACKFTPDGGVLCTASDLGVVELRESRILRVLHTLRNDEPAIPIRCLEFTRDGRYLLTGNKRGTVHVWNLATRSLIHTLNVSSAANGIAIECPKAIVEKLLVLPGNRECVVVTRSLGISVWDLSTGRCVRSWAECGPPIHSATLAENGRCLLTGNACGEIWSWDISTGKRIKSVATHSTVIRSLATNPNGTIVVSGDLQGGIRCRPH